ncbi:phosphotransferase [Alteromonas ponticola]|uniref:Phosphotransferase n=1 Tax=Alteromonas aquimaris TaxID=2998417 RepID=A0ABT3P4K6_9ALTE|nr:phosphotransferase [Alteromonas aquimaris]MCW8107698.1 phosphotransferase [Alteromonas aquimaris]
MDTGNGDNNGIIAMHLDSIVNLLANPLKLTSDVALTKIEGGVVNQTFKLTDRERTFAVKWIADDEFSGINRFHQFVLQEQLAHRKIAPMPVWLSDDGRLWVESWYEPTPLSTNTTEQIKVLATVLFTIHSQPITARPLKLTERLHHYVEIAQLFPDDPLVHQINEIAERIHIEVDDTALTLCHNDLAFAHILDSTRPLVVDWEYAAMGNRYFDIASAIEINKLSESYASELCSLYAKQARLPEEHVSDNVHRQIEVVKLTNTLWQQALEAASEERLEPPVVL